jgi:RNA polymerase sigma-H factor
MEGLTDAPAISDDEPSVQEMISDAKNGDTDAFARLLNLYGARVRRVAYSYFLPRSDREELLQEARIGFFNAVRDYRAERGRFEAFATTCVQRRVISFVKRRTRRKHSPLNRALSLDGPVSVGASTPLLSTIGSCDPQLDRLELAELFAGLMQRCTILEREVLRLYAEGFSFFEIARMMGVRPKRTENALWRAKEKARRLYTSA